ncbi:hypothetical protein [Desulfovibrio fairfieldensis]|uniref:hypothetical protein n=1 Tax=Desulfovibrio fairfieldensis TaxID=44742 RepID=UPI000B0C4DAA|nr:hypothetical protein [Desulfovibrio fairfieldensis]
MVFDIQEFANTFKKMEQKIIRQIGINEYNLRLENIAKNMLSPGALYRESSDRLFLYLLLSKALISNDMNFYNYYEGTRIIPVIYNLAKKFDFIYSIKNFENKISSLCSIKNKDIDSTLFEILTAIYYYIEGYSVTFLEVEPPQKSPDILIEINGIKKFIECKKMRRGNDYTYKELKAWYQISDRVADLLEQHKIVGYFHFKFTSEVEKINPKRVFRKIYNKLSYCKNLENKFYIVKNNDFKIKFTPIDKSKFDVVLETPLNTGTPSFIHYLIDDYNYNFHYKPRFDRECQEGFCFISKLHWASLISCEFACKESIEKKSQYAQRLLVDATRQLSNNMPGNIHILIEECQGELVHIKRLLKNFHAVTNFKCQDKFTESIYIHYAKYITPINDFFDVEETVTRYSRNGHHIKCVSPIWYPSESIVNGFGTLFHDYRS